MQTLYLFTEGLKHNEACNWRKIINNKMMKLSYCYQLKVHLFPILGHPEVLYSTYATAIDCQRLQVFH